MSHGYINDMKTDLPENPASTGSTQLNGAPMESDRNSLSVGTNGPLLLHDVSLVEKLARFDRENVPERLPHAKGGGAFGTFEVTGDVSKYTKAAVFQPGASTEVLARFSTVAGEQGSPDTWRDVRGFAIKMYTDEGNLDIVGNNTPVFFVRDPMKFPDFIHSQRRTGAAGLRNNHMQWDFWTNTPESAHQVTYLMGDRGLPASWREMNGYSSHTYMWVNKDGEKFWVNYSWQSNQGVRNLTNDEAEKLAGADADYHRRDLFEHIAKGEFPSWDLEVQVIPYAEAKDYKINIFDLTKTISLKDYPRIKVGTMTLNRNPENFFAQIEQAAFSPSNLVPGTGFSPDKMLLGRVFSYPDAQRHRIGANHMQLPVNQPKVQVNNYGQNGPMAFLHNGDAAPYAANSQGRSYSDFEGATENGWEADGEMVRAAYQLHPEDDDFSQAGVLVREVFDDAQRERFVETVSGHLAGGVEEPVLSRAFQYWKNVDQEIGERIEKAYHAGKGEDVVPGANAEHNA